MLPCKDETRLPSFKHKLRIAYLAYTTFASLLLAPDLDKHPTFRGNSAVVKIRNPSDMTVQDSV